MKNGARNLRPNGELRKEESSRHLRRGTRGCILYSHWGGIAVDVGNQASPQEVFFGTEYRNPDLASV
jgi:hypothetical protein